MNRWLAAALVLGLGIPVQVAGQEEREEANKRLVRAFVQAINDRDFDALDDLVAEDLVRHSPSTPGLIVRSREDFKAFLREDVAAVPDSKQTIRMMVAEGDMVAGWNTYAGTQTGAMGPYPPSGKRVELDFAGFLRIEEGRIAELWVVWDNVDMLTQLGHLEPPGSGVP